MKTKLKSDVFLLIVGFIFLITCACSENPIAQYHMVNVNEKTQGDAHYIKIDDKNILIDTGSLSESKASLVPYLKGKGVGRIDILYISHMHKDHYPGVKSLLKAGINISSAYVIFLPKKFVRRIAAVTGPMRWLISNTLNLMEPK